MLNKSSEYRFFNAYEAYRRAKNPAFKQYWYEVMQYIWKNSHDPA